MEKNNILTSLYTLKLSSKLMQFLAEDDFLRGKKKHVSRIKAFYDIAEQTFLSLVKGQYGLIALSDVTERWNWSRPTIIRYINQLRDLKAIELPDPDDRKSRFFRLSPEILSLSQNLVPDGQTPVFGEDNASEPSKILFSVKNSEGTTKAVQQDQNDAHD